MESSPPAREARAQAVDVHVHGALGALGVPAPYLVKKLHARVGAPRALQEELEQPELLGRQADLLGAAHHYERIGVEHHAAHLEPALAARIVELHRGSIDVQSTPGRGSVFEVRLPARRG